MALKNVAVDFLSPCQMVSRPSRLPAPHAFRSGGRRVAAQNGLHAAGVAPARAPCGREFVRVYRIRGLSLAREASVGGAGRVAVGPAWRKRRGGEDGLEPPRATRPGAEWRAAGPRASGVPRH